MMSRDTSKWERIGAEEQLLKTKFRDVRRWRMRHPDQSGDAEFDLIFVGDYIFSLGYFPETGLAIMEVNDRVTEGFLLEVPSGGIENSETPSQAALREFSEETPGLISRSFLATILKQPIA